MKHLLILYLFVTSVLLPYIASAEEETITLSEVVVTATRYEETKENISASIQVITGDDIKNSTADNVGDLITEASIGHIQKYPSGLTSSIGLRGFRTNLFDDLKSRVLVLINGHRIGTVNLAKIPIEDIERIEIVKGPASVLYGSSAMGGVINIITKVGKEGIHGSIGGEIGSWDYWKSIAELNGKKGAFDFYLTASRSSRNDYDAKDYGKIENTGYNDETVSARFGYKFFDKHHISIGFQHWRGWEIGSQGARYDPDPDDYSDRIRDNLEIGYKTGTFNASYYLIKDKDEYHEGSTAGLWDTPNAKYTKETQTQGVNLQKTFSIGYHKIIIGGQWDRIKVESSSNSGAPYNPNSKYDSYGVFTEGRLSLFNKKLLLSAGIRYDYFENEILKTEGIPTVKPTDEEFYHVTLRGGFVYKLTEDMNLKGNVGTAFRAPAPDEIATDYISSWGTHWVGNPDLKPEKSISYDIGIDYTKSFFKGEITFFHSDFEDKIISYYDETLSIMTFKNVDGASTQGIEASISYDIGLSLGLNFSIEPFANVTYHTKYESKDEFEINKYGETLLYTPKWTSAFGIRAGQDKWDVRLIANYTGDEKVQDWATYPYPVVKKSDFTIVNIKGTYRPIKNLEITASVENLFDRAYEYVPYYPMPGMTFMGGMKFIF